MELLTLDGVERAQRPEHLPAARCRRDAFAVLDELVPPFRLIGEILYGSGLRLLESLSIRRKDIDLDLHQIMVRRGKGEVDLPQALRQKMPSAARSFAWQYLFPATRPCADPATGRLVLDHLHESAVQKAVLKVVRATMISTHIVDHGPLDR